MTDTKSNVFDLATYRLSVERMAAGVWFDFLAYLERKAIVPLREPTPGVPCARLAAWGNERFAELHRASLDGRKDAKAGDSAEAALTDAMAGGVVTGLSGFVEAGKPIEFSTEAVRALLGDAELPQFRDFVFQASRQEQHYRKHVLGN